MRRLTTLKDIRSCCRSGNGSRVYAIGAEHNHRINNVRIKGGHFEGREIKTGEWKKFTKFFQA